MLSRLLRDDLWKQLIGFVMLRARSVKMNDRTSSNGAVGSQGMVYILLDRLGPAQIDTGCCNYQSWLMLILETIPAQICPAWSGSTSWWVMESHNTSLSTHAMKSYKPKTTAEDPRVAGSQSRLHRSIQEWHLTKREWLSEFRSVCLTW